MTAKKAYRGRLTNRQIAEGMTATAKNAQRLLADATLLVEAGRWPSAASIAILSIEESGKGPILRSMAVARSDEEIAKLWKDYRAHRVKNAHGALLDYLAMGARRLSDFTGMFQADAEHTVRLDDMKQSGLYVDLFEGPLAWAEPDRVIDQPLALQLVRIAAVLARQGITTEREIELWVEHMADAWLTPDMPYALILWQQAMYEEGLVVRSGSEMADFIFDRDRRTK